ncbi:hypothetical protein [Nocardia xishanensis]|uniref:hypothetical protein n=1 Tax=Nocardia xishanensis TaxID=238964 RepID=UPI00157C40E3|nr:hypothetical protein [Nocardia xishanensis]
MVITVGDHGQAPLEGDVARLLHRCRGTGGDDLFCGSLNVLVWQDVYAFVGASAVL